MMTLEEMNQIRKELGLSYQEICLESGIPIGTVQKVLGGVTKNPRFNTMVRLEDAIRYLKARHENTISEDARVGAASEKTPAHSLHSCSAELGRRIADPSVLGVHEAPFAYGAVNSYDSSSAVRKKPHVYTEEERDALPDDRRTELIDGILYDMASPSYPHQTIAMMMYSQINDCIHKHHSKCVVFMAPADVRLDCDKYTMVQPDVFIVCDRKQLTKKCLQGAPAFILEVLSPSTRSKDKKIKLNKYMEAGVQEYWMIDPDKLKVIVFYMGDSALSGDTAGRDSSAPDRAADSDGSGHTGPIDQAAPYGQVDTNDQTDPYDIFIYSFHDRIPLGISQGKCVIDMNPIREELRELYPDEYPD